MLRLADEDFAQLIATRVTIDERGVPSTGDSEMDAMSRQWEAEAEASDG